MNNSSTGLQNETTTDQGFQITQGEIEAIKLMFETQKYLLEYIQPVLMGLFGGAGNLLIILYFLKIREKILFTKEILIIICDHAHFKF